MNDVTGAYAAQYFKYCMQFKLPYIVNKLEFRRIASKSLYSKYKSRFDQLADICNKYNVNIDKFIKYFIDVYEKNEIDIKDKLVSKNTFIRYSHYVKELNKKRKIFKWFIKSANNIADDCIKKDLYSTKDYIRDLILNDKLAQYYITGVISKYWLSGIPKFKNIIVKMTGMSRDEFKEIYDNFDIYNSEINEAFLIEKKCKVNPIQFTDRLIAEKRQKNKVIN